MPAGISDGLIIVRATRSATEMSTAPRSAQAGMSTECLGPTSLLARWGTSSPTKLMLPPMATQDAAMPTAAANSSLLSRAVSMPRPLAVPSPRESTSSTLDLYSAKGMSTSIHGRSAST